jgi:hypothetical protein
MWEILFPSWHKMSKSEKVARIIAFRLFDLKNFHSIADCARENKKFVEDNWKEYEKTADVIIRMLEE